MKGNEGLFGPLLVFIHYQHRFCDHDPNFMGSWKPNFESYPKQEVSSLSSD